MRILIVGSDKVHAIENFFLKYMHEPGTEVRLFAATSIFYDYYYNRFINKFLYRSGLSGILSQINNDLKGLTESFKPDIIWVFKGMELLPETLQWIRNRSIKLVNYNPDNPFIFTGRGSGNKHISDALHLYDLHFTYSLEILDKLKHEYDPGALLLPFAFDVTEVVYEKAACQTEIMKACFLGNPDKRRVSFIKKLAEGGVGIDLYGNNWERVIEHPLISIYPPVYELELWNVLRRYRIQINIMRIHNINAHNMRSFEVPAIGGIMLAPDTPDHRLFFDDGKEAFLFRDEADCISQIKSIMTMSETAAMHIRQAARHRSLSSGYSYKDRAAAVLSVFHRRYD